jgi:hypothetical protein
MNSRILLLLLATFAFSVIAQSSPREIGRRLASIKVQKVSFKKATVPEVIQHLATIAQEADTPVNIVLENSEIQRAPITLVLRGENLRQILQIVCRMADLRMEVRYGVLFIGEAK